MRILNIKITNPQALEYLEKIKSGEAFLPIKNWFIKAKWYLISFTVVFVLIVALVLGKKLSEKTAPPIFIPPDIESPIPTTETTIKSEFSGIKEEIKTLNTDLPDPFIPVFDNAIKL